MIKDIKVPHSKTKDCELTEEAKISFFFRNFKSRHAKLKFFQSGVENIVGHSSRR